MASTFIKLPKVSGGGGGGGAVDSFNGRTGTVVSQSGDYSAALISSSPSGSISSTNVQAVIVEVAGDLATINSQISTINSDLANKQPLDAELTAIAAISSNGFVARTGAGAAAARTLQAGSNISISNPDGSAGNPSIALSGTVPISNGGTGVTTTPAIGQLLIGNGTSYAVAQLTAGSGIAVTNGPGSVTISNSAIAAFINIDGGVANTVFGGTGAIDGGNA